VDFTDAASISRVTMVHNSQSFLVDSRGRLRATFFNAPLATVAQVTHTIAVE
jgi:protein SCO1